MADYSTKLSPFEAAVLQHIEGVQKRLEELLAATLGVRAVEYSRSLPTPTRPSECLRPLALASGRVVSCELADGHDGMHGGNDADGHSYYWESD